MTGRVSGSLTKGSVIYLTTAGLFQPPNYFYDLVFKRNLLSSHQVPVPEVESPSPLAQQWQHPGSDDRKDLHMAALSSSPGA